MSAESSALNLKRWGSDFGLGSIFGPKVGTTPTALAARWLGLAMSGPAGSGVENVKAPSAIAEREPGVAVPAVTAPPSPAQATAVAAEGLSTADRDRMLVIASLSGDQSAFGELVSRYQSAVY